MRVGFFHLTRQSWRDISLSEARAYPPVPRLPKKRLKFKGRLFRHGGTRHCNSNPAVKPLCEYGCHVREAPECMRYRFVGRIACEKVEVRHGSSAQVRRIIP